MHEAIISFFRPADGMPLITLYLYRDGRQDIVREHDQPTRIGTRLDPSWTIQEGLLVVFTGSTNCGNTSQIPIPSPSLDRREDLKCQCRLDGPQKCRSKNPQVRVWWIRSCVGGLRGSLAGGPDGAATAWAAAA